MFSPLRRSVDALLQSSEALLAGGAAVHIFMGQPVDGFSGDLDVFAGEDALPLCRQLLEVRFFAAHFVAKQSGAQGRIAALWTFCWRGSPAEGGAHPLLLLPAVAAVTVPWHPCKPHKVCRCSLLTQCRGRAAASAPSSSTSVAEQLKSI